MYVAPNVFCLTTLITLYVFLICYIYSVFSVFEVSMWQTVMASLQQQTHGFCLHPLQVSQI